MIQIFDSSTETMIFKYHFQMTGLWKIWYFELGRVRKELACPFIHGTMFLKQKIKIES